MRSPIDLPFLFCLPLFAGASNDFGKHFLEENAKKDGVVTLASGLQYKVLRSGIGSDSPTATSPCECHYEGRTAENYPSGQKFDSSYDRGQPATFAPNQVIKGWTEAMQLMVEGDKWEMYIPSSLAYGDGGRPPKIPGGAVLIFTMEIIKIKGNRVPAKKGNDLTPPATQPLNTLASMRLSFTVANLVGEPSEASFIMEIRPDWAPLGAQRLQELVSASFFDNVRFFRVIDNFMVQFGIHGDPSVMRKWEGRTIKDDQKKEGVGNKRGTVSFATSGANTRSTQLFINFKDNTFLDGMGFTPVAEVVSGMDVVDRLFKIGEVAPDGPGPSQGLIQARGNVYLNEKFPQLSYVKSCSLVGSDLGSTQFLPKKASVEAFAKVPVVQDLNGGLKLEVIKAGDGKTFPHAGDVLTVHYVLTLARDSSGKVIDSSRSRSQPFSFTVGRGEVIQGWDQGVLKMSLGQRSKLTVPSSLAYGAKGAGAAIPPNAELMFDVEILGIGDQPASSSFSINVLLLFGCVAICGLIGIFLFGKSGPPKQKSLRRTVEMTMGKSAPE